MNDTRRSPNFNRRSRLLLLGSFAMLVGIGVNHFVLVPRRKIAAAERMFHTRDWAGLEALHSPGTLSKWGWKPGEYAVWMARYIEPYMVEPTQTRTFLSDAIGWYDCTWSVWPVLKNHTPAYPLGFTGHTEPLVTRIIGRHRWSIPRAWVFAPPLKLRMIRVASMNKFPELVPGNPALGEAVSEYAMLQHEKEWLGTQPLSRVNRRTGVPLTATTYLTRIKGAYTKDLKWFAPYERKPSPASGANPTTGIRSAPPKM